VKIVFIGQKIAEVFNNLRGGAFHGDERLVIFLTTRRLSVSAQNPEKGMFLYYE
jgi:hypothetical protein